MAIGLKLSTLWVCLGLFVFRVAAQLLQLIYPISWLPSFNVWHSSTLPYWLLLSLQCLIAGFMMWVTAHLTRNQLSIKRRNCFLCLGFGIIYLLSMTTRLALGQTMLANHDWLYKPVPTIFHLVLATFVCVASLLLLESNTRSNPKIRPGS
jgi:hypothetical protein